MASKIKTDDPRHHKYVSVNKRERKKWLRHLVRLASLLFPRWMFKPRYGWARIRGWGMVYYAPGTRVAWDDCNHKTFRLLERRRGQRTGGKTERRYRRQYYRHSAGEVIHYKKGAPC